MLLAQLRHKCVVSHLKDARYRLGRVRAARDGEVHRSIELGTTSKKTGRGRSVDSMAISLILPSRPHSRRRSSSSFASRQSSTMHGIWTTLSAQPTKLSNGRFYGTLEWQFPADNAVRTAEIGGRSRQAQHDHQGRLVIELANSRQRDPLLGKAIAERLGEEVRGKDDLRKVVKSAVGAESQMAGRMDGARQLAPRRPQWWKPDCIGRRVTGRAVAATRGRGETLSSQSPTTMYL